LFDMGSSAGQGKKREFRASDAGPVKRKRVRTEQTVAAAQYLQVLQASDSDGDRRSAPAVDVCEEPEVQEASNSASKDVGSKDRGNDDGTDCAEDKGTTEDRGSGDTNSKAGARAASSGDDPKISVTADLGEQNGSWTAPKMEASSTRPVHVTVVLECANLEAVKLPGKRGGHALLSSEEHGTMLRKMKRDPNDARPDITHQCLLTLLDSPLNKAGRLTVYIRTKRNVLIAVHAQTRIPRTIRRFSGLMVELLERLKVRSTNGTKPLLQVIRNPITSHLPVGQRRIVCTYNCDNIIDVRTHAKDTVATCVADAEALVAARPPGEEEDRDDEARAADAQDPVQVLYIIGAMAHGKVEVDYGDEEICISEYPLSAATVCSRIMYTYECMMGIL
jgi:rRNA small subunit pseudouridine methyltransferase Nep1